MQKTIVALLIVVATLPALLRAQDTQEIPLVSETDSLSYSLGMLIGNNLAMQGIHNLNNDAFMKGFQTGCAKESGLISFEGANMFVQSYFEKQMSRMAEDNLQAGMAFLEENARKEGVVTLNSGLQYKVLKAGDGNSPKSGDQVRVHYRGTLVDGTVFDSSYERGEPAEFGVSQVIRGWTEALLLMSPGSHWMLFIPPDLAYGENGAGDVIGPNSTLIFEVELLEVLPGQ